MIDQYNQKIIISGSPSLNLKHNNYLSSRAQSNFTAQMSISTFEALFKRFLRVSPTVEEDDEDAGVGELLATQQVDVLNPQVHGQLDDGPFLHVRGDVGHQGQVLHQATRLTTTHTQHLHGNLNHFNYTKCYESLQNVKKMYTQCKKVYQMLQNYTQRKKLYTYKM